MSVLIEKLFFENTLFLTTIMIGLVLFDSFFIIDKKADDFKQSCIRLFFYLALTLIFMFGLGYYKGHEKAALFAAGYLLEYSLSLDNLFIFLIIVKFFNIKEYSNKVLSCGIVITVVLRLIFINFGVLLVEKFNFALAIFGVLLLFGAYHILRHEEDDTEVEEKMKNGLISKIIHFFIKIDYSENGAKLFVIKDKKLFGTKILVATIFVFISDIICTFDSIPAIFGITTDVFIIYSSNIFAVLGLRSAYVVIIPFIEKVKCLEKGIVFVLIFIGIKLIISAFYPDLISVKLTLIITAAILFLSFLSSFFIKTPSL